MSPISLFSQKNGYYIDLNDRKVYGEIFVESAYDQDRILRFKATDGSDRVSLNAAEIKAYSLEGERYYFSRQNPNTEKADIVFWETIIKGKVSLHKFKEKYFLEFGNRWEQLYIREVKEQIDGKQYSGKTNDHIKILSAAFEDCEALKRDIVGGKRIVSMTDPALVRLVKDYHICANQNFELFKTPSLLNKSYAWLKLGLEINGGLSITNPDLYENIGDNFLAWPDFGRPVSMSFGLGLELYSPRISSRFRLVIASYYQQNTFKGAGEGRTDRIRVRREVDAKFNELSIPYGLKFIFRPSWNNACLSFGFTHHMYSDAEFKVSRESEDLAIGEETSSAGLVDHVKSRGSGVWASIGLNLWESQQLKIPFQVRFVNNGRILEEANSSDELRSFSQNSFGSVQFYLGLAF